MKESINVPVFPLTKPVFFSFLAASIIRWYLESEIPLICNKTWMHNMKAVRERIDSTKL